MDLVRFQYEEVSLDVRSVLMRNTISLTRVKNQEKVQVLLHGVDVGNKE